jgi:hypothetical protein
MESSRKRVLDLVEELEKETKQSNGRTGCTMFALLGLTPVMMFMPLDVSIANRLAYTVTTMVAIVVLFVSCSLRGDKRRLKEILRLFDQEFPPDTPRRRQAVQVLIRQQGRGSNRVIDKILEQLPLSERTGQSAEESIQGVRRKVRGVDPFPRSAAQKTSLVSTARSQTGLESVPELEPESVPSETSAGTGRKRTIPLEIDPTEGNR